MAAYKELKKAYSKQGIKTFLFFNLVIAFIWFNLLYVHQDDYSQFDLAKIKDKIKEIAHQKVIVDTT
jgi:hypothetical protein